jgi:3-oxoacyl-[acyl-carrier protein] reductase
MQNGKAIALRVDVSSEADVGEAARATVEALGRIDILINNAGLVHNIPRVPIEELGLDDWNRVMSVNLTGTFLVCKAVVPYLKQAGGGRIINISSSIALHGRSGRQDYAASKAGVIGLTRALAVDLGEHNITVNAITPGGVATPAVLEELRLRPRPLQTANKCIPRLLATDDLTGVAALLASDESAMITGQVINVDGGTVFVG